MTKIITYKCNLCEKEFDNNYRLHSIEIRYEECWSDHNYNGYLFEHVCEECLDDFKKIVEKFIEIRKKNV